MQQLGRAARLSAIVVGALVVLQVVLLLLPDGGSAAGEEPALSPTGSEIAVGLAFPLVVFVVLTAVVTLVLTLRARRERRTAGAGR